MAVLLRLPNEHIGTQHTTKPTSATLSTWHRAGKWRYVMTELPWRHRASMVTHDGAAVEIAPAEAGEAE